MIDAIDTAISTIVSTGIVGLFGWMYQVAISERIRSGIQTEYAQKLETHKAELKAQGDVEIERLRSRLSLVAAQKSIVFSKLHEKRGEAVEAIYGPLRQVHYWLGELVNPVELTGTTPKSESFGKLEAAHTRFREALMANGIYLPARVAEMLEELNKQVLSTGNVFIRFVWKAERPDVNMWIESEKRCSGEIKSALTELESALRQLLGGDE